MMNDFIVERLPKQIRKPDYEKCDTTYSWYITNLFPSLRKLQITGIFRKYVSVLFYS